MKNFFVKLKIKKDIYFENLLAFIIENKGSFLGNVLDFLSLTFAVLSLSLLYNFFFLPSSIFYSFHIIAQVLISTIAICWLIYTWFYRFFVVPVCVTRGDFPTEAEYLIAKAGGRGLVFYSLWMTIKYVFSPKILKKIDRQYSQFEYVSAIYSHQLKKIEEKLTSLHTAEYAIEKSSLPNKKIVIDRIIDTRNRLSNQKSELESSYNLLQQDQESLCKQADEYSDLLFLLKTNDLLKSSEDLIKENIKILQTISSAMTLSLDEFRNRLSTTEYQLALSELDQKAKV